MAEQHVTHRESEQRDTERNGEIEPTRHIPKLWIGVVDSRTARFESHAANWAIPRCRAHNFGVHRTNPIRARWRDGVFRLECHPALGACAGLRLAHLRVHGTNVGLSGRRWLEGRRCDRYLRCGTIGCEILFGIRAETLPAF